MNAKRDLRLWIRTQFPFILSAERHARASEAICRAIKGQQAWQEAERVCAFLPLSSEPRIMSLWECKGGPLFCFPLIRGNQIELVQIDESSLGANIDWRLEGLELDALPRVGLATVDLLLVPGLAFTPDGRRLGRGGGHYDRLLARCGPRQRTIGVCFSTQLVLDLPMEEHDQRVGCVITESGVA